MYSRSTVRVTYISCLYAVVAGICAQTIGIVGAISAPVPAEPLPRLILDPEVTTLVRGDPLLAKIELRVGTRSSVILQQSFSTRTGVLSFEVCGPGDMDFRPVQVLNQGLMSSSRYRQEVIPSSRLVAYEWIFPSRKQKRIIDAPGRWTIRVVLNADKIRLTSAPVLITVTDRPPASQIALALCGPTLEQAVTSLGSLGEKDIQICDAARKDIGKSHSVDVLDRAIVLYQLASPESPIARNRAIVQCDRLKETLPQVAAEHFELEMLETLLNLDMLEEFQRRQKTIPWASLKRESLRTRFIDRISAH